MGMMCYSPIYSDDYFIYKGVCEDGRYGVECLNGSERHLFSPDGVNSLGALNEYMRDMAKYMKLRKCKGGIPAIAAHAG